MLFSRSAGKSKRFFTIFGKVPSMTDFLAVQASHPMVKDLDRLVQGVMTAMAGNHEWKQQFDAIPAVDLMWRSPAGPEVFIGVLLPSQDAAGRRYPLLGGLVLPGGEAARYGPLLLLGAELFCSRLRDLLCRAREDAAGVAELRDYLAEQASGKGMDLLEPALLGEIYNNFINEENALELGRPAGEASPATALRRTVLHLLFSRSQGLEGRDEERKYLVLPLSLEPGKSMLHASVWMDLLALLADPSSQCPWGQNALVHPMDGAPCLFMHPGRPSALAGAGMLGGKRLQWNHFNLQSGTGALHLHPLYPEISTQLDRFITSPAYKIVDLKKHIGETVRQLLLSSS
jgi:type VI secretion system ImpM family protein